MYNNLCILLLLGMFTFQLSAQSQVESMLRDAKVYNKAYLDKDFAKFSAMTVPSIVELAGGPEVMNKVSEEQYRTMVNSGITFISIIPQKPGKIMVAGEDLHAILPQLVITSKDGDEYHRTAYYLASSDDDGKTWTFVDLEPYDTESIKVFVPSFTGALKIPEVEYAVKVEK